MEFTAEEFRELAKIDAENPILLRKSIDSSKNASLKLGKGHFDCDCPLPNLTKHGKYTTVVIRPLTGASNSAGQPNLPQVAFVLNKADTAVIDFFHDYEQEPILFYLQREVGLFSPSWDQIRLGALEPLDSLYIRLISIRSNGEYITRHINDYFNIYEAVQYATAEHENTEIEDISDNYVVTIQFANWGYQGLYYDPTEAIHDFKNPAGYKTKSAPAEELIWSYAGGIKSKKAQFRRLGDVFTPQDITATGVIDLSDRLAT